MRQLSPSGQRLVDDIAKRHGFSVDATLTMLDAVIAGNGGMAQFSHPEFAGSGQWMRGGMTMVSDLFNNTLKNRVDALCSELAKLAAEQPDLLRNDGGSFQSQSQGGAGGRAQTQTSHRGGGSSSSAQHQDGAGSNEMADGRGDGTRENGGGGNLFSPGSRSSGDWWPADLRHPDSTGSQNGVRYACFSQAHRLVIDVGGTVSVYDTLDHRISGFSQQQSSGATLSFSSQHGLVDVASLPVVSSNGKPPAARPAGGGSSGASQRGGSGSDGGSHDVFATIERLADLKAKGILSEDEFAAKKAELLSRV